MKNRPEKIFSFLAILISVLLIACSVFARYDELTEIDLLSSHPTFENADLEGLEADKQNRAKMFVQSDSPEICFSSFSFIKQIPHFFSPLLSSPQSISVLRC
jgi:hypothetical protein